MASFSSINTPFVSSSFSRVSSLLGQSVILGNMRRSQEELLRVQEQLATGLRILRGSDDPIGANRVMDFSIQIKQNEQYMRNIDFGSTRLTMSDASMDDMNELLNRSREILLSQVQSTATQSSRLLSAQELSQILEEAVTLGNTRFEGRFLFAGSRSESTPLLHVGDAIGFVGDEQQFLANISRSHAVSTNVSADDAFGVYSDEVIGRDLSTFSVIDLNPRVTGATHLSALNQGAGVMSGSIQVTGSSGTREINLSRAETVSDLMDLVNAQTSGTGVSMAINAAQNGFTLTDGAAGNIIVQEVTNGTTAFGLGIRTSNTGAGAGFPVIGTDRDPIVTDRTLLRDFFGGAGISNSGITITNATSTTSYTATFGPAVFASGTSVQQLLNSINSSNVFVDARLNDTGTGINIVSRLSGARLTISENGGTTASTIGLLSTVGRARLTDLNNGLGLGSIDGNDIQITMTDGRVHIVDVDAVTRTQELVTALNNLSGITVTITAADEISITDTMGGSGTLSIIDINGSFAATNLGIETTASGVTSIIGTPLSFVGEQVEGIYTALINIRDALRTNNVEALKMAGALLDRVQDALQGARANVGSRISNLDLTVTRISVEQSELHRFRSQTQDIDLAEAASRFSMQETVLQASLAVASRILQTTIFNFL